MPTAGSVTSGWAIESVVLLSASIRKYRNVLRGDKLAYLLTRLG
jgi:hypothetical protein